MKIVSTKACRISLITVLLLAVFPAWTTSLAQAEDQVFFPETGHWVKGEFLETYQRVAEPLLLYGYPITEAFIDRASGRTVQYFQRARLELHPDAIPELRVQLTPLGEYLYTPGQPLPLPDNFPACRLYPQTGFQVCYTFLEFFNAHGGVAQFGYPISNFEYHDERIVQYFQRSRFEWHPERPSGERVTLTDLGRHYFDRTGENPLLLLPVVDNNVLQSILDLKVRAFSARAVTGMEASQTIYVIVQDQNLRPVPGARVELVATLQSENAEHTLQARTSLPLTNDQGLTRHTFSFTAPSEGIVKVRVFVTYDDLGKQTITSFRIWW